MSRERPAAGATMSLFPFLAVLLCTMGALLVLLVLFSRRARDAEMAEARAAQATRADELTLARDELAWRLEQLRGVRDRTAADLARARMLLAGAEDDSRALADELETMERTAAGLVDGAESQADEPLDDVEARLVRARRTADEARAKKDQKPAAYAVVPYEGDHGTRRRPLYIECCIDGVFLQPEGIRLGPSDFEGPPGPGNPLASALRAAREHIATRSGESGDPDAQPYPLMLVRPSGVMAYYAARESIQSWGSEFGYQFVDEDWEIAYPPADPALAEAERRAVEEARRRLTWLAQVRPAQPRRAVTHYRAATTRGGVVADGGPSVLGDQSRFDWTDEQAVAGRGGTGGGLGAGGSGATAGDGTRVGTGGRQGGGPLPGGGDAAGPYAGPSTFYAGAGPEAPGGVGTGDASGPHATGAREPGGTGGTATTGSGANATAAAGPAGGAAAGDGLAAHGSGGSVAGGGGDAGSPTGSAAGASAVASGGQAGSAGGGLGGASPPGPSQDGAAGAAVSVSGGGSGAGGSLAGARGSNWASLATQERPIPLTRPIRVECAAQEFRLLDEGTGRVASRVPIGTHTAESVDPLVKAVHARVAGWGIAGDRMYWRPQLVLTETHDGRGRREDLERLLADSGLDTRRAGDDAVRSLPPVGRVGAVSATSR